MWALLVKPFVALLVLWLVMIPIRRFVQRKMPEGRLKRFFLIRWD
jgi:hypothetical protein